MNIKNFMQSRTGVALVVLGAALALSFSIYFWYGQAGKQLDKNSRAWGSVHAELSSLQASTIDASGRPRDAISYAEAERFIRAYEEKKGRLGEIEKQIAAGDGMSFWLPSRRARTAGTLKKKTESMAALVEQIRKAARAIQPQFAIVRGSIADAAQARSKASGLLRAGTEMDGYSKSASDLEMAAKKIDAVIDQVRQERASGKIPGRAENFRLGMIKQMELDLAGQRNLLEGRISAARAAQGLLASKMSQMNGLIADSTGIYFQVGWIAEQLEPAAERAYQMTQPLRRLLEEADRPLFGDAGNLMGRFMGGGERLSALSLACQVDPNIKVTVDALNAMCTAIETARSEIAGILDATRPLARAVFDYRSRRSREAMISLAASAKNAYSHFVSRTMVFNPVLAKLEEGRSRVNEIYRMAQRIRAPGAQELMGRLASTANEVITFAEGPFERAHRILFNLVSGLNGIPESEQEYQDSLKSLASDPPQFGMVKQTAIAFQGMGDLSPSRQPFSERQVRLQKQAAAPRGIKSLWIFQDSDRRYLIAAELDRLDANELWQARNEIYARRGYRFKTARGKAYGRDLGEHYLGNEPDAEKVYAAFNRYEKSNIELIIKYEKQR